jgi:hypothetical protein
MSKSERSVSSQRPLPENASGGAAAASREHKSAPVSPDDLLLLESEVSVIGDLPGFLSWEAGTELVRSACEIYVGYAYHQLRTWAQFTGSDVFQTVLKLPKSNQQRLLIAPRLFRLLRSNAEPREEEIESLKEFIRMEQYLCKQSAEHPGISWTALGDFYLPAETEERQDSSGQPSTTWNADLSYEAPVSKGIVLDAYSPIPANTYPDYYGEVAKHSAEEMNLIEQRLETSLDHIQSVSATASSAVKAAIQVMALVCAPALTAGTHSFSTRSTIGQMGLVNVHTEPWVTERISNAIIHESIHSLIYKLQLKLINNLYTDDEAAERVTAVSPWSGRTLFLHSVVHACFVWFGLWSFWSLSPIQDDATRALKEKAARGFLSGPLQAGLSSEAYECIRPDTRLAIDEMFKRVTSADQSPQVAVL